MTESRKETDETGREILVHQNGMIQDASNGRTIKAPNGAITTSERGRELANVRHEGTRSKIRKEILKAANESRAPGEAPFEDSDSAFANAAGRVFGASALNEDAYPRDRIDGLESIGKMADLIPRDKRAAEEQVPGTVRLSASIPVEQLLQLAEALRKDHARREEEGVVDVEPFDSIRLQGDRLG